MNKKRVKGIWNQQKRKFKQEFTALTNNEHLFSVGREVEMWENNQLMLGKSNEELWRIIRSN